MKYFIAQSFTKLITFGSMKKSLNSELVHCKVAVVITDT